MGIRGLERAVLYPGRNGNVWCLYTMQITQDGALTFKLYSSEALDPGCGVLYAGLVRYHRPSLHADEPVAHQIRPR